MYPIAVYVPNLSSRIKTTPSEVVEKVPVETKNPKEPPQSDKITKLLDDKSEPSQELQQVPTLEQGH